MTQTQSIVDEDLAKRYIVPQNAREIERLRDQHEWVKGSAGGLIKAPINAQRCRRVLDSATADGYWLQDVMSVFPRETEYVGFDVAYVSRLQNIVADAALTRSPRPHLFIPADVRPSNISLVTQNLVDPFPAQWTNNFDFVHQRFILPLFNELEIETVLASLIACLKPGAWIQFVEPDFSTPVSQPADKTKAFQMIHQLTGNTMADHSPGKTLSNRLRQAGLANVDEDIVDMIVGYQHPNAELRERSYRNYMEVIGYYHSCNQPDTFGMSQEEWAALPEAFASDMKNHRTAIRHYFVWAQKPEVAAE